MPEITIYGVSDDLVEVEGCKGADEFTYSSEMWRGDLVAPDGGSLRVHTWYDGVWRVAVGQVDEDVRLPAWPMRLEQGNGTRIPPYSTGLVVDAPEGTRLTNVGTDTP
jgi:hypothetical protein